MSDYLTARELPTNLADDDAVEAALVAEMAKLGWNPAGPIFGDTRSNCFGSTGTDNRFNHVKSTKESVYVEFHKGVGTDEWLASAGTNFALAPGIVHEYLFNTVDPLKDEISGNDFTSLGDANLVSSKSGSFNQALRLEKDDTGIEVVGLSQATIMPSGEDWTIDFFAKVISSTGPPSVSNNHLVFKIENGSGDDILTIILDSRLTVSVKNDAGGTLKNLETDFDVVVHNDWRHFMLTYRASDKKLRLYRDGSNLLGLFGAGFGATPTVSGGNLNVPTYTGPLKFKLQGSNIAPVGTDEVQIDAVRFWTEEKDSTYATARASESTEASGLSSAGALQNRTEQISFYPKKADALERTIMISDGTNDPSLEEATYLLINTHNTTENGAAPGEFNPVIVGRLPREGEPYLSALSTSLAGGETDITVDDDIYPDMDPDQNTGLTADVWITDVTNGNQERVTLVAPTTAANNPSCNEIYSSFPAGSIVSDFPYKLVASRLLNENRLFHIPDANPANLLQSFNENYEGSVINIFEPVEVEHQWTFNEAAGASLVDTTSFNSGTFTSITSTTSDTGIIGGTGDGALRIPDEITASVQTPNLDNSDGSFQGPNGEFSFAIWVNTSALSGTFDATTLFKPSARHVFYMRIGHQGGAHPGDTFSIRVFGTNVSNYAYVNDPNYAAGLGTWNHYMATCDGTTLTVYKNGALLNSAVIPASDTVELFNSNFFRIYGTVPATGGGFNLYDGMKWSGRVWTASERNAIYEGSSPTTEILDPTSFRVGHIPSIRNHGTDAALVEAEIVHLEREDKQGGFKYEDYFKESTDTLADIYSITRGDDS